MSLSAVVALVNMSSTAMTYYSPCYEQLRPTTWKSCSCSHAVRPWRVWCMMAGRLAPLREASVADRSKDRQSLMWREQPYSGPLICGAGWLGKGQKNKALAGLDVLAFVVWLIAEESG